LHLRKCPELAFIADDSIAYGAQINRILEDLQPETDDTDFDEE